MLGPGDLWYKDAIIYSLNVETFQDSDGDDRAVIAIACWWHDRTVVTVHNLDSRPCTAGVELAPQASYAASVVTELLSDRPYAAIACIDDGIELDSFGYRWFRLAPERAP